MVKVQFMNGTYTFTTECLSPCLLLSCARGVLCDHRVLQQAWLVAPREVVALIVQKIPGFFGVTICVS